MGLEPANGGRAKKLIWAVEAHERHGRPMCSECNDRLRDKRGCSRPGMQKVGNMAFRFTSPMLDEADQLLRECPVSVVLTQAPHVYDVIPLQAYADAGAIDPLSLSHWAQRAIRIVSSERARLLDLEIAEKKSARDSKIGLAVRRGDG